MDKTESNGIKIIPVTAEVIEANKGFLDTKGNLLKALRREKETERKLKKAP